MKHGLERAATIAGVLIMTASLLFGACLLGSGVALFASLLLSAAGTALWRWLDLPARRVWLPPLLFSLTSLVAVLLVELTLRHDIAAWFCVPVAAVGSAATLALLLRDSLRCSLCGRRMSGQSVVFQCPRCDQQVCDATCWNFDHRRCQLCLEQRVSILPTADSWWSRRTGPRTLQGRCQICLAAAEQADLRACPYCRRPQCRECWDFNNGECQRCHQPLPDLPPSLTMAVANVLDPR